MAMGYLLGGSRFAYLLSMYLFSLFYFFIFYFFVNSFVMAVLFQVCAWICPLQPKQEGFSRLLGFFHGYAYCMDCWIANNYASFNEYVFYKNLLLHFSLCLLCFHSLGQFSNDPYRMGTYLVKAALPCQPRMWSMFLTQFCLNAHKDQATFYLNHHQKYQLVKVIYLSRGLFTPLCLY